MRTVIDWHTYHMQAAEHATKRSKDPNTNVGAVLINPETQSIIKSGYNGFPKKVKETPERWTRPLKYEYVSHAEANAIALAACEGRATRGAVIYCTHYPCQTCAKLIIQAGIKAVYLPSPLPLTTGFTEEMERARELLEEASVPVFWVPYQFGMLKVGDTRHKPKLTVRLLIAAVLIILALLAYIVKYT